MKGLTVKPREIAAPSPVIDLMAALKRSLAREASGSKHTAPKKRRYPIGASRLSCCQSRVVGNGKHRPPSSPPLPPQAGLMPTLASQSECESDQPERDGHVLDFIVQCRDRGRVRRAGRVRIQT
jgi:hypothetical protein